MCAWNIYVRASKTDCACFYSAFGLLEPVGHAVLHLPCAPPFLLANMVTSTIYYSPPTAGGVRWLPRETGHLRREVLQPDRVPSYRSSSKGSLIVFMVSVSSDIAFVVRSWRCIRGVGRVVWSVTFRSPGNHRHPLALVRSASHARLHVSTLSRTHTLLFPRREQIFDVNSCCPVCKRPRRLEAHSCQDEYVS